MLTIGETIEQDIVVAIISKEQSGNDVSSLI